MRIRKSPTQNKFSDYLEADCLKGLSETELKKAKKDIKKFHEMGLAVPYGIIRKSIIDNRSK